MTFIKGVKLLSKKELGETFSSPMIYIFTAIFSFLVGGVFYNNLSFIKEVTNVSIVNGALAPTFSAMNFMLMIFAPMITMGCFVKEKREHTLPLLKLSKIGDKEIFWGKYIALIVKGLFIILPSITFPIILSFSGFNDWAIVLTNYIGIIGLFCCYLVVGAFASLLTRNYIIAIVLTFGILFSFLILASTGASINNEIVSQLLKYASLGQHTYYFARGAIVSYDLVYFASFIGFFSYVSVRLLGVRR
ncbi:MAG: hypothetical protein BM556_05185 [Bacteriovorax sp. MedPE-SWde]|nr:MAG: hypothetical protein BM556_05185 [Bacteriovorax sp. MedPE-SWde]